MCLWFQFHFGSIGSLVIFALVDFDFVSIPLWFDWKVADAFAVAVAFAFQFHFGSIGRAADGPIILRSGSFNSTLVRLEAIRLQ